MEMNNVFEDLSYGKSKKLVGKLVTAIEKMMDVVDTSILYQDETFDASQLVEKIKGLDIDQFNLMLSERNEEQFKPIDIDHAVSTKATPQKTRGRNFTEDHMIRFIQKKDDMMAMINVFISATDQLSVEEREVIYDVFFEKCRHEKMALKFLVSERTLSNMKTKAIVNFAKAIQLASLMSKGAFIMPVGF